MAEGSQVADVGLHIVVAPKSEGALRADLIHNTEVPLDKEIRRDGSVRENEIPFIEDRVIEEALGSEDADLT